MYLIVAGGDGTLMFIVDDTIKAGLDIESMEGFCMLPYGTSNDLGRIMGWGKQPKYFWTKNMKKLIEEIVNAK